jgi:hypothetical protein
MLILQADRFRNQEEPSMVDPETVETERPVHLCNRIGGLNKWTDIDFFVSQQTEIFLHIPVLGPPDIGIGIIQPLVFIIGVVTTRAVRLC